MTAWDETFALDMQRRISQHKPVSDEEAAQFHAMVTAAIDAANTERAGAGRDQHPWTDQQAHDVYARINQDPESVTAQDADDFAAWAAEQGQPTLARGEVPPVPGPQASIEDRNAYIKACGQAGVQADPAVVAAFHEQVSTALRDHTADLESRYPAGFFHDGRPQAPESTDAMREELHTLYARQQADPGSVTDADLHAALGRLDTLAGQHATEERRRQLPWVLPADQTHDGRGIEPGAIEAMTAPAPWTPRESTGTEQTLAELDQLDQEAAGLDGDAA